VENILTKRLSLFSFLGMHNKASTSLAPYLPVSSRYCCPFLNSIAYAIQLPTPSTQTTHLYSHDEYWIAGKSYIFQYRQPQLHRVNFYLRLSSSHFIIRCVQKMVMCIDHWWTISNTVLILGTNWPERTNKWVVYSLIIIYLKSLLYWTKWRICFLWPMQLSIWA